MTGGSGMVHSRDVVLILMLATATGACAQPDDAAQNGSAPGAAEQATPQDAPVVVSDTPEDSLIFERTVAWVRESRSDTLPIGGLIAAIGQRFVGAPYTRSEERRVGKSVELGRSRTGLR